MSSCLSGRAYGFDIENIIKCQTTCSSNSSSSTLSESSNSPITISNRKPRTPRKRPNQTYNEAAVLLSIACPKVFSTKNNNLSRLINKQNGNSKSLHLHESPELLIENSGFFLHQPIIKKPNSLFESKASNLNSCSRIGEFRGNCVSSLKLCDGFGDDDFDTESMLDEEIEGGIDSIMGNSIIDVNDNPGINPNTCYGYPMGLGFGGNLEFKFGYGMRNGIKALKKCDDGNWWGFPTVNVNVNVAPPPVVPLKVKKAPVEKKKKKKKKRVEELMKSESESELELGKHEIGGKKLLLKLNYDDVLNAWSDKESPLPEDFSWSESPGGDIHARLAEIELFSENGGISVLRYKEKKLTRLFSKKIRYQVRKVNADTRPRSKGRFVRRANSPTCDDT